MIDPIPRKATPTDARPLAELMDQAGGGIPAWLWAQDAEEGQSTLDVGMVRARREQGSFSYRNAHVFENDGRVVGMLLGYFQPAQFDLEKELDGVPDFLVPIIEMECQAPGSFYIHAIAVYPEHRTKGYGSLLMAKAERLAREHGGASLSLIAFEGNTRAVRLYERLGFEIAASRPVVEHESVSYAGRVLLMIREIK